MWKYSAKSENIILDCVITLDAKTENIILDSVITLDTKTESIILIFLTVSLH